MAPPPPKKKAKNAKDTPDPVDSDEKMETNSTESPESPTDTNETRDSTEVATSDIKTRRSNRQRLKKRHSSSETDEEEYVPKATAPLSNAAHQIHVGDEYQAYVDEPEPSVDVEESIVSVEEDRDTLIWRKPIDREIDDHKMDAYCTEASDRFRLPIDRALFILMLSDYNFEKAIEECSKRRIVEEIWTKEEETVFRSALQTYGKNFARIKQVLAHRSLVSIIQYYYRTKRSVDYTNSAINEIEINEDDDSSDELKYVEGTCENCGEKVNHLILNESVNRWECHTCQLYLKHVHVPRPTNLRSTIVDVKRANVSCPTDYHHLSEEFMEMSHPASEGEAAAMPMPDMFLSDSDSDSEDDGEKKEPKVEKADQAQRFFGGDDDEIQTVAVRVFKQKKTVCQVTIEKMEREIEEMHLRGARYEREFRKEKEGLDAIKEFMRGAKERYYRSQKEEQANNVNKTGRVRHDHTWTEKEKNDVMKCFTWDLVGDVDFESVAHMLGSKSADKIKAFYQENKEMIDDARNKERQKLSEVAEKSTWESLINRNFSALTNNDLC